MNRKELVAKIAARTKMTPAQIDAFVDEFTTTVKSATRKGDDVKIVGFGTFTKIKRKARMGRNPSNGKAVKVPAKWVPKFRAGSEFKQVVR